MGEYMKKAKEMRKKAAQRQKFRTCSRVMELPWQEDDVEEPEDDLRKMAQVITYFYPIDSILDEIFSRK
jgi:hypothetical protein